MKRFLLVVCIFAASIVYAGNTVTSSKTIVLQRSSKTLTETTSPKLACQVTNYAECEACALQMYTAETKTRTRSYVTYRCVETSSWLVKFNKTPVVEPDTSVVGQPPAANLQIYSCPEANADGRILESKVEPLVVWPNCPTAVFANPSKSLIVAVNPGAQPLMWRDVSTLASTANVWAQTKDADGKWVGKWTRMANIQLEANYVNLSWFAPTQNTDGTPLEDLAGYRILYGTSADALTKIVEITNLYTEHLFEGLAPATYYFVVRAVTSSGNESANSNIASKTIQ